MKSESVEKETNFLLHLVDVAWKAATQSEEVPDTGWAIDLIAEAKKSIPIKSRKNHMEYSEEAVKGWLSEKEDAFFDFVSKEFVRWRSGCWSLPLTAEQFKAWLQAMKKKYNEE
jgi:hypothetical protein